MITSYHGLKNRIGGKTRFAFWLQIFTGFENFLGLAVSIQFLKLCILFVLHKKKKEKKGVIKEKNCGLLAFNLFLLSLFSFAWILKEEREKWQVGVGLVVHKCRNKRICQNAEWS